MDIDKEMKKYLNKVEKKYIVVFIVTLIFGLFSHGVFLSHKLSIHDDLAHMFDHGGLYISGRWMQALIGKGIGYIFGDNMSLPLWNGIISIIIIAVSTCIIIKIFEIDSYVLCILVSIFQVSRPIISGLFGYMFTAPYHMFGECLAYIGVFFILRKKGIFAWCIGIMMLACSTGIYQAFIPCIISLILYYYIVEIYSKNYDFSENIKKGIYYVISMIAFIILYAMITKVALALVQQELLDYKGISEMWNVSSIIKRILLPYKYFFNPDIDVEYIIYPGIMQYMYYPIIAICMIILVIFALYTMKKNIRNGALLLLCLVMFPMACNFIYIMCDAQYITGIMIYGKEMLFIFLLIITNCIKSDSEVWLEKMIPIFSVSVICISCILYIRTNNVVYLKADLLQNRLMSWSTTLVTRIKSTEGYDDNLPIAYIGEYESEDATLINIPQLEKYHIVPYSGGVEEYINNFAWRLYTFYMCGFWPDTISPEEIQKTDEIAEMSVYPDDGSIKVIDNTVVVKLSEE